MKHLHFSGFSCLGRGQLGLLWPNWPQLKHVKFASRFLLPPDCNSCLVLGTCWVSIIRASLCISVMSLFSSLGIDCLLLSFLSSLWTGLVAQSLMSFSSSKESYTAQLACRVDVVSRYWMAYLTASSIVWGHLLNSIADLCDSSHNESRNLSMRSTRLVLASRSGYASACILQISAASSCSVCPGCWLIFAHWTLNVRSVSNDPNQLPNSDTKTA